MTKLSKMTDNLTNDKETILKKTQIITNDTQKFYKGQRNYYDRHRNYCDSHKHYYERYTNYYVPPNLTNDRGNYSIRNEKETITNKSLSLLMQSSIL